MTGQVAGSIERDRKPRQRRTLEAKLAVMDEKIKRAEALVSRLRGRRGKMIEEAREAARAAAAALENLK